MADDVGDLHNQLAVSSGFGSENDGVSCELGIR